MTTTTTTTVRTDGRLRVRDGACVRHAWLAPHPTDRTLICGQCNRRYDPDTEPSYKTQAILRSLAQQTIEGRIDDHTMRQAAHILIRAA